MPAIRIPREKFISAMFLVAVIHFVSCHSAANNAKTTDSSTVLPMTNSSGTGSASIPVPSDDSLNMGVRDAVKDYPGVTAVASQGEITLTGDIASDRLPNLMMSLNALHPKKINNNLTVK